MGAVISQGSRYAYSFEAKEDEIEEEVPELMTTIWLHALSVVDGEVSVSSLASSRMNSSSSVDSPMSSGTYDVLTIRCRPPSEHFKGVEVVMSRLEQTWLVRNSVRTLEDFLLLMAFSVTETV